MKTSLFLALLLCNLVAADPTPSWAIRGGGPGNDSATQVRALDDGSVIVAGYFYGTASWGGAPLVSTGSADIVLAKYDSLGAPVWSRSYGSAGNQFVTGMALDGASNIVLCGWANLGDLNLGGQTFTNLGGYDAWVAKYDRQGNHVWSVRYGGPSSDLFNGVAVDSQGNVVVVGWFQGTANFGSTNMTSTFGSAPNVVVAKYAPNGTPIWSRTVQAGNGNYGNAIATGPMDSIVVGGSFFSWIDFGGGRLTAVAPAYQNIFLAKLDPSGLQVWAKRYGGAQGDAAQAVATDPNGDVLATGKFYRSTDLGGGPIVGSAIDIDGWVAKYRGSDGAFVWGNGITGNNGLWATTITSDANANAIVGGYYYGKFNFGGTNTLTSVQSSYDGFVASYKPGGQSDWAISMGGPATDAATCVTTDRGGDVMASGYFSGTAKFGTNTLVSAGSYDGFIVEIPTGATPPPTPVLTVTVTVNAALYAPGDTVAVRAVVTSGAPIVGALVTFSLVAPLTGQVYTGSAITDADGDGDARWSFVIPTDSQSGKWTGTAIATKTGYTAGSATFTFCSCACK